MHIALQITLKVHLAMHSTPVTYTVSAFTSALCMFIVHFKCPQWDTVSLQCKRSVYYRLIVYLLSTLLGNLEVHSALALYSDISRNRVNCRKIDEYTDRYTAFRLCTRSHTSTRSVGVEYIWYALRDPVWKATYSSSLCTQETL